MYALKTKNTTAGQKKLVKKKIIVKTFHEVEKFNSVKETHLLREPNC